MKSIVKNVLKEAGGYVGGMAGSQFGMAGKGASLGTTLGGKLSRLLGTGDYSTNDVRANSLFPGASRQTGTMGTFEDKGGVRLRHREFVQDMFSGEPGAFKNFSFPVNPGLSQIFPYMSQIAANYEQYRFHGLVFEFVSSTAPYGATSLGTNMMAMEYNSSADPFSSKPQLENSDYAISARLDKSLMYGVECAPGSQATNYLYVRSDQSGSVAVNLLDLGLMNIATVPSTTLASGSPIGEIWVSYDVELIRPRISPTRFGYAHIVAANVAGGLVLSSGTALAETTLKGDCSQVYLDSTGLKFPFSADGTIYKVDICVQGTGMSGLAGSANFTLTNLEEVAVYADASGTASANPIAGISATGVWDTVFVRSTGGLDLVSTLAYDLTIGTASGNFFTNVYVTSVGANLSSGDL